MLSAPPCDEESLGIEGGMDYCCIPPNALASKYRANMSSAASFAFSGIVKESDWSAVFSSSTPRKTCRLSRRLNWLACVSKVLGNLAASPSCHWVSMRHHKTEAFDAAGYQRMKAGSEGSLSEVPDERAGCRPPSTAVLGIP